MTNLYWISGSHIYSSAALKNVLGQYKDANIMHFKEDYPPEQLESFLMQSGLIGAVNNIAIVHAIPSTAKFKKLLDKNIKSTLIVYKVDKDKHSVFSSEFKKRGEVLYQNPELTQNEAVKFITKELDTHKKQYDALEIEKFLESSLSTKGMYDFDTLYLFLKKLLHYLGNDKKISYADLQSLSAPKETSLIWDIFNFLDDKNFDQAYKIYSNLLENEDDYFYERFLYVLYNRYKLLIYCKESLAKKVSKADLHKDIKENLIKLKMEGQGQLTKFSPELTKENKVQQMYHDYTVKLVLYPPYGAKDPLACYSRKELVSICAFLQKTIANFRKYNLSLKKTTIDFLFLLICKKIDLTKVEIWKKVI